MPEKVAKTPFQTILSGRLSLTPIKQRPYEELPVIMAVQKTAYLKHIQLRCKSYLLNIMESSSNVLLTTLPSSNTILLHEGTDLIMKPIRHFLFQNFDRHEFLLHV